MTVIHEGAWDACPRPARERDVHVGFVGVEGATNVGHAADGAQQSAGLSAEDGRDTAGSAPLYTEYTVRHQVRRCLVILHRKTQSTQGDTYSDDQSPSTGGDRDPKYTSA